MSKTLHKIKIVLLVTPVIKDDRHNDKYKEIFLKSILPKVNEWYQKVLLMAETSVPGVETLLVEWTGYGFKLHSCRFA